MWLLSPGIAGESVLLVKRQRVNTLEYWTVGGHTALTSIHLDTFCSSLKGCGHEIAGTFSTTWSSGPETD